MKPAFIHLFIVIGGILLSSCVMPDDSHAPFPKTSDARFHMVDAQNGWLEADDEDKRRIFHTTDGGQSWTDVTPRSLTNRLWDCQFPTARMAWATMYYNGNRLLLTTNAGQSWMPWTPLGNFDNSTHNYFLGTRNCRFFNSRDGLAEMMDCCTCQAEYNFFETHDGGASWRPAAIIPPQPACPGALPGTFTLGDCDGSAIAYYPPRTIVIVQGDLMDEAPKGVVRLSQTTNAGASWHEITLPLPEKYQDCLVSAQPPYFFDGTHALLHVNASKWLNNGTNVYKVILFYASRDGGIHWRRKSCEFDTHGISPGETCLFLSQKDILLYNQETLLRNTDSPENWQNLKPDIGKNHFIAQVDFADKRHGWLVATVRSNSSPSGDDELYRTTDGGFTWAKLTPQILGQHNP